MAPELTPATLCDLLQRLKQCTESERNKDVSRRNYAVVVQAAEEVLEALPGDEDALRYKLVALIQCEELENALSEIQRSPGSNLDLKAYCLYCLRRFDEALKVVRSLERSSFALQLEAQILYKQGDIDGSTAIYRTLLADDADEEVKCNAIAVFAAGNKADELAQLMDFSQHRARNVYELAYNTGCILLGEGALAEAEEHLKLSKKIGQEKLIEMGEDPSEQLAPVDVQLAYIEQVQGHAEEAATNYLSILKRDLSGDMPTLAVASNNLAAARKNKEVFDSLRKFEAFLEKNEDGKRIRFPAELKPLSSLQKEAIIFNYLLLLLAANKLNQVRELVPLVADEYQDSSMPYLIRACLFLKEGKLAKAEEILNEYAQKHSEASMEALLLGAQARASAGNYVQAADSLQRIEDVKHMPAVVATIVDLRQRGGDLEGAESVLVAAVEWWSNSMDDGGSQKRFLELITPKAAELKLLKKKYEDAAKLYETLTSSSSDAVRLEAFTGLVCSYAETDFKKAESYQRHLPSLETVTSLDALERSGVVVPETLEGEEKNVIASEETAKKKRKRKPRYPKGYDPQNPGPPPDPERWLPMRDRSTYRPKKKDKRAAIRGSQGSVAKEQPASNGPSTTSSRPSSSASAAPTKPETKPSNQRSKKKGRR